MGIQQQPGLEKLDCCDGGVRSTWTGAGAWAGAARVLARPFFFY